MNNFSKKINEKKKIDEAKKVGRLNRLHASTKEDRKDDVYRLAENERRLMALKSRQND